MVVTELKAVRMHDKGTFFENLLNFYGKPEPLIARKRNFRMNTIG